MNIFESLKTQLDQMAARASASLENQNLADILKSAAGKVGQVAQHPDVSLFDHFLHAANKLAGDDDAEARLQANQDAAGPLVP